MLEYLFELDLEKNFVLDIRFNEAVDKIDNTEPEVVFWRRIRVISVLLTQPKQFLCVFVNVMSN